MLNSRRGKGGLENERGARRREVARRGRKVIHCHVKRRSRDQTRRALHGMFRLLRRHVWGVRFGLSGRAKRRSLADISILGESRGRGPRERNEGVMGKRRFRLPAIHARSTNLYALEQPAA